MRAALLCLLLAGCATQPRLERVEVPVPVPCRVAVPDHPVFATEGLPASAGIWEQAKALLAERQQRIAYEAKLEAAAKACQ